MMKRKLWSPEDRPVDNTSPTSVPPVYFGVIVLVTVGGLESSESCRRALFPAPHENGRFAKMLLKMDDALFLTGSILLEENAYSLHF